jgi:hypothetical protein
MAKASAADHAYFARIARANAGLVEEPPSSLDDVLIRMAQIRRHLGPLAEPGKIDEAGDGDLTGHLRFLAHIRARSDRGR